jgi:putative DNA primase/helicase
VLNQRGLEDRFNSDWCDSKLLILAEEVVTRAEMWHIKNELKELVSGDWIRVNPKNLAAYRQRNQVNIVYLSNENQPLPIDNDDRRHLVVYTPPHLDESYYDEVFLEIENGGVEAFYHYLLALDLGDFHPKKRPPMTASKEDLIELSRPSEDRFLREWRSGDLDLPFCPCLSMDLYAAYLRWCRLNGEIRPRPSNHFLAHMGKIPGWVVGKQAAVYDTYHYEGTPRQRRLVLPSAQDLEHAARRGEDRRMAEGKSQQVWLTDCYLAFAAAVEGREQNVGRDRAA